MHRKVTTFLILPISPAPCSHQSFHPSHNYSIHPLCLAVPDFMTYDLKNAQQALHCARHTFLIPASDQLTLTSHKFPTLPSLLLIRSLGSLHATNWSLSHLLYWHTCLSTINKHSNDEVVSTASACSTWCTTSTSGTASPIGDFRHSG